MAFGAAISLDWVGCIICLIVTILVRNFFGKITLSFTYQAWPLMVLPLVFIIQTWWLQQVQKLGSLWKHHLISAFRIYEDSFILMLSRSIVRFLQRNKGRERLLRQDWFLILELTIYTIPVFALLASSRTWERPLVFLAIFAGLVLVSGVSWKIILPVILLQQVG